MKRVQSECKKKTVSAMQYELLQMGVCINVKAICSCLCQTLPASCLPQNYGKTNDTVRGRISCSQTLQTTHFQTVLYNNNKKKLKMACPAGKYFIWLLNASVTSIINVSNITKASQ